MSLYTWLYICFLLSIVIQYTAPRFWRKDFVAFFFKQCIPCRFNLKKDFITDKYTQLFTHVLFWWIKEWRAVKGSKLHFSFGSLKVISFDNKCIATLESHWKLIQIKIARYPPTTGRADGRTDILYYHSEVFNTWPMFVCVAHNYGPHNMIAKKWRKLPDR